MGPRPGKPEARRARNAHDLDDGTSEIAGRGIVPDRRETYDNGARKAIYRDPDRNEIRDELPATPPGSSPIRATFRLTRSRRSIRVSASLRSARTAFWPASPGSPVGGIEQVGEHAVGGRLRSRVRSGDVRRRALSTAARRQSRVPPPPPTTPVPRGPTVIPHPPGARRCIPPARRGRSSRVPRQGSPRAGRRTRRGPARPPGSGRRQDR